MNPIQQPQTQRPSQKTREERRRETATMTKCRCGNVARNGTTTCSRCAVEDTQRESEAMRLGTLVHERAQHMIDVQGATTVEDLKPAIMWLLEREELK